MVLGTLGTGKSHLLNTLSGADLEVDEPFESKMQTTGCTKNPKWLEFKDFNLLDSPGLNDPNMNAADWAQRHNDWSER